MSLRQRLLQVRAEPPAEALQLLTNSWICFRSKQTPTRSLRDHTSGFSYLITACSTLLLSENKVIDLILFLFYLLFIDFISFSAF